MINSGYFNNLGMPLEVVCTLSHEKHTVPMFLCLSTCCFFIMSDITTFSQSCDLQGLLTLRLVYICTINNETRGVTLNLIVFLKVEVHINSSSKIA